MSIDENSKILLARVATALECIAFTQHATAVTRIASSNDLTTDQKTTIIDKLNEGLEQLARGQTQE